MRKIVGVITLIVFFNITACGYFLYPERVGRKSGKLDPSIVVLDAAALLFGILPGVVAFAVDITTGAIYLPPGQQSVIDKHRRTLRLIDGKALRLASECEIPIDQVKTAHELSQILGFTVASEKIKYFRTTDMQAVISAMPVKSTNLS